MVPLMVPLMAPSAPTDGDSKLTGMAELTVGDVMERDPVTIAPDADLETLLRMLRENELPGLPVVEGDRLVGIVTESDLVLQGDDTSLHLPHYFQLFGGVVFLEPLQHLEDRIRKAFANSVSDMMTTDVETISPDATVHEAARMISSSGHNRVPVVEGDRLVGVVTRVDALEALTREG
jgi:CBS domain-containing protein